MFRLIGICCYNLELICASMRVARLQPNSELPFYSYAAFHHHLRHARTLPHSYYLWTSHSPHGLVKRAGSRAPVGEEQAQPNCLEDASDKTNGNLIQWALLSDDLRDELESLSHSYSVKDFSKLTPGAVEAKKIKLPK